MLLLRSLFFTKSSYNTVAVVFYNGIPLNCILICLLTTIVYWIPKMLLLFSLKLVYKITDVTARLLGHAYWRHITKRCCIFKISTSWECFFLETNIYYLTLFSINRFGNECLEVLSYSMSLPGRLQSINWTKGN